MFLPEAKFGSSVKFTFKAPIIDLILFFVQIFSFIIYPSRVQHHVPSQSPFNLRSHDELWTCSQSYQELIANFETGERCDLIYISEDSCSKACYQGNTRGRNCRKLLTVFTATIVGRKAYEGLVSLYSGIMYLKESTYV